MIRSKKEIEIFKHGEWIEVRAIISEELLCKKPGCNRKPFGQSNNNEPKYCCNKHAQQHIWSKKKMSKLRKKKCLFCNRRFSTINKRDDHIKQMHKEKLKKIKKSK